jgi:hypothetical protein
MEPGSGFVRTFAYQINARLFKPPGADYAPQRCDTTSDVGMMSRVGQTVSAEIAHIQPSARCFNETVQCLRHLYPGARTSSPNAKGQIVSDRAKKTERRERAFSCPRCGTATDEVVSIAPTMGEPGLVGYECPKCVYVTSELVQPSGPHSLSSLPPA